MNQENEPKKSGLDDAVALFSALPDEQQAKVIAMIKSLLSEQSPNSAVPASDN